MRKIPLSRSRVIGSAAACAILAGTLTVVSLATNSSSGSAHPAAVRASSSLTQGRNGPNSVSAALLPEMAAAPQIAVMPNSASARRARSTPGATAPGNHSTLSGTSAAPSGSPSSTTTAPPVTSGSSTCTHPQFETSDPSGMWNLAPYFVFNNMWNASNYTVSQTLYACSYSNWYVVATANNDSGDGAVKTYPNSHRDFDNSPAIDSFKSITSTFAETSPHAGIYEDAYDIWLNGIASSGSTEVMIWTENYHQVPGGSVVGSATFDGRSYTVWKGGSYVAFVANTNFTSGTVNLLEIFKWIMSQGWIPADSTLGQVDYGAEIVSTNNVPATFTFSNFAVNAS
jgi:Glycosyl hydrolase family 12